MGHCAHRHLAVLWANSSHQARAWHDAAGFVIRMSAKGEREGKFCLVTSPHTCLRQPHMVPISWHKAQCIVSGASCPHQWGFAEQKLPVTVPELVESSPSLAADGSLVIGSRHTNVYLLDANTGLLDHMFLDVASLSSSLDGLSGQQQYKPQAPKQDQSRLSICFCPTGGTLHHHPDSPHMSDCKGPEMASNWSP